MKRAIINVAIGEPYTSYQNRFIESVKKHMSDVGLITYTDQLPPGSRNHQESMYGFKMYAFQEAFKQGYESVIWLDSPTVLHSDIGFLFDLLENNVFGDLVVSTECYLYQYCNDNTLKYFGVERQEAKDRKWMLNYGFVFGFTKDSETYQKMFECERRGLFTTSDEDYQDHMMNSGKAFNGEYVEHRHEESVISMIVQSEGRELLPLSVLKNQLSWEKTPL